MNNVTLITPTGGRPEALALCHRFVVRQTFRPFQWIIVDDGPEPTAENLPKIEGVSTCLLRPDKLWKPGTNTLGANLLVAIPHVAGERVLFIEDDDWYSPRYVEVMSDRLLRSSIIGESHTIYYHVGIGVYFYPDNRHHASLCQTGIQSFLLSKLAEICINPGQRFIDIQLWEACLGEPKSLTPTQLCVGIKGLPGRPGTGIGHRPLPGGHWHFDREGALLKDLIGGPDAELYAPYRVCQ